MDVTFENASFPVLCLAEFFNVCLSRSVLIQKKKPFRESTFNVNVQKCGLLVTSAGSTPDAIFRAQVTIGLLSGCVVFVVLFFYEVV